MRAEKNIMQYISIAYYSIKETGIIEKNSTIFTIEAYSGAGKTHLCQQVENQKEYAI